MLHVSTCLWDANDKSQSFSRCYTEEWADKLFRGFKRNLQEPFVPVVFTDRIREFAYPGVEQIKLSAEQPDYGCLIEPFQITEPNIVCGLDTVLLGRLDNFVDYCWSNRPFMAPRNPYNKAQCINPIVLVPRGNRRIYDEWDGENDMTWLRRFPCKFFDDVWPDQVLSLKAHDVRRLGPREAKVVYFHGDPKPQDLMDLDWVRENWV